MNVRRSKWTALRNFLWFNYTNTVLYWLKTINLLRVHERQVFLNSHSVVKKQISTTQRSFSETESTWQMSFVVNEILFLSHSLFHYFSILIYLLPFPLFLVILPCCLPLFTHLVLVIFPHNNRIIKNGKRPLRSSNPAIIFSLFLPALISLRFFPSVAPYKSFCNIFS